uniref:Secreted protein n=1 Tax=Heterorhabditis bacteriophora TaxID=37862 RepID=A0A1I7WB00_HETBA
MFSLTGFLFYENERIYYFLSFSRIFQNIYKYRKKCTIGQIEAKNLFLQKNLYGISFLLTSSLIFYGSSTTHKPRPFEQDTGNRGQVIRHAEGFAVD